MHALLLGRFIFVVGKAQIHAAAVNIDQRTQIPIDHDDAFRVPARPSFSPRAVPADSFVGYFPEGEIIGISFGLLDVNAGARFQRVKLLM